MGSGSERVPCRIVFRIVLRLGGSCYETGMGSCSGWFSGTCYGVVYGECRNRDPRMSILRNEVLIPYRIVSVVFTQHARLEIERQR